MISLLRRSMLLVLGLGLVIAVAWVFWPKPVPVDIAVIEHGSLEVTVEEEGRTRVRDIYTVSAPISGRALRAPLHVGDQVVANHTVVALLQPTMPSLLDVRTRKELEAARDAAQAAVGLAEAEVMRASASLDFARSDFNRIAVLARSGTASVQALERARMQVQTGEATLTSAIAALEVRKRELKSAEARLIEPVNVSGEGAPGACCIELRAPASGEILKLEQESERVVTPGTPLVEIGDPRALEVVVDLLSTDAVRVETGSPVRIEGWGGGSLEGRVRRVESAGFTKTSALGIEEQRVRAIVDLIDAPERWNRLGHDYRVIARIQVSRFDDVPIVPLGALFRRGEDWAVYVIEEGRARLRRLRIGQRNNRYSQVVDGLAPGDQVVVHPSDDVKENVKVVARERS
jgi:HlyD family secretion protein